MSTYKKTAPLFLYFQGQMHLFPCVYLYFHETIFTNILCTFITKYTLILNFNFSNTIYPQLRIVCHFNFGLKKVMNQVCTWDKTWKKGVFVIFSKSKMFSFISWVNQTSTLLHKSLKHPYSKVTLLRHLTVYLYVRHKPCHDYF